MARVDFFSSQTLLAIVIRNKNNVLTLGRNFFRSFSYLYCVARNNRASVNVVKRFEIRGETHHVYLDLELVFNC